MSAARIAGVALLAIAALLVACEKPDASDTTSPSALALLGTTYGNVVYDPPEPLPVIPQNVRGWDFDAGNVRFSHLENGVRSLQVVTELKSQRGPGFEVWMEHDGKAVARWSGGSAKPYTGAVCLQLRLEDKGESLQLTPGEYSLALVFRDPATGEIVAGQRIHIAGETPKVSGAAPAADSRIFRDLLSCPRSVI
ncbi:hypothetical protein AYO38_08650 [bacterium SCGC AG-212-C10]|nr:hypothetical protein AYO38_08650 [bacterium SCGC AG-212-C10]